MTPDDARPEADEIGARAMAPCGRTWDHPSHGGPTATRDASCDGRVKFLSERSTGNSRSSHFSPHESGDS